MRERIALTSHVRPDEGLLVPPLSEDVEHSVIVAAVGRTEVARLEA